MNVNDERGWDELARDWTAPASAGGAAPRASAEDVRRRARLQSRMFAGEMLFGVVVLALLAWRAWAGDAWPGTLAATAFTVFAMVLSLWAWRLRPAADTGTVREALEAAIAQARAWVRWAIAGYAICAAAMGYLWVVFPHVATAGIVFGAAYVLAVLAILAWVHRQQRRRIAGLLALRGELADEA